MGAYHELATHGSDATLRRFLQTAKQHVDVFDHAMARLRDGGCNLRLCFDDAIQAAHVRATAIADEATAAATKKIASETIATAVELPTHLCDDM